MRNSLSVKTATIIECPVHTQPCEQGWGGVGKGHNKITHTLEFEDIYSLSGDLQLKHIKISESKSKSCDKFPGRLLRWWRNQAERGINTIHCGRLPEEGVGGFREVKKGREENSKHGGSASQETEEGICRPGLWERGGRSWAAYEAWMCRNQVNLIRNDGSGQILSEGFRTQTKGFET